MAPLLATRRRATVLLQIAAAFALLPAACQPLSRPFADDVPPPGMLTLRDNVGVTVVPIAGLPRATADKLLPAMTKALQQRDIAAGETANPAAYRLVGQIRPLPPVDGKTTLIALWQLRNPSGKRVGERMAHVVAAPHDWQDGSSEAVLHLAAASADAIATLLQEKPPAEVAVKADARPRLRIDSVTGAPGDGGDALAKAIAAVLQRQGVAIVGDPAAKADLDLACRIDVDKPKAGKQHIKIAWHVSRPGGPEIGTANQENDVPAGLLDGAWGDLAYTVALAAEGGIIALVERGMPQPAAKPQ